MPQILLRQKPNVNISPTNQTRVTPTNLTFPASQSSLTKQLFAHCGANPNHFPQHQVVLIDWGPTPALCRMLCQRKLARLHAFIARELYRTESRGPSNAGSWPLFRLFERAWFAVRKQLRRRRRRTLHHPKKQLETPFSYYSPPLSAIVWN